MTFTGTPKMHRPNYQNWINVVVYRIFGVLSLNNHNIQHIISYLFFLTETYKKMGTPLNSRVTG